MSRVAPLPVSEATDKTENTYRRLAELLGTETVPDVFLQFGRVPAFLQDFFMNFKKFVFTAGKLDERQKAIIALAVATNSGSAAWSDFYIDLAQQRGLTDDEIAEVLAVAATNTMYNVFFKFRDISGSDIFSGMSVGLRAHTFRGVSLSEQEVELIDVTLSDINGCKPCVSGHVEKARQLDISDEALLEAIQVAAVVHGSCQFTNAANA